MTMGCCGKESEDGEKYKARKHEPDFKGPIDKRSCTDVICCLIFIVFILALAALGVYAFVNGDYRRIIFATNTEGQLCGQEVKGRDYLYFFNLLKCIKDPVTLSTTGCLTPQVCVKTCPTENWFAPQAILKEKMGAKDEDSRKKMVCLKGRNGNYPEYEKIAIEKLIEKEICAPFVLKSKPLLGRCIPSALNDLLNKVGAGSNLRLTNPDNSTVNVTQIEKGSKALAYFLAASQVAANMLQDLIVSWQYILIILCIGLLISLLWIVLLRFTAVIMVWVTLIAFVVLFGFATVYSFIRWNSLRTGGEQKEEKVADNFFEQNFRHYLGLKDTWLAFGIIAGVLLLIIILLLIFLRSRIRIAIALIGEASRAIGYMMSTLLWPIFPFVMEVIVLAICLAVGIHLSSIGDMEFAESDNSTQGAVKEVIKSSLNCDPQAYNTAGQVCQFVKYKAKEYVLYMQFYNLFMYFWLFNFVIALGQMTLAGAFASYYFAFTKPKDIPTFPLLSSLWRSIRYHLGTLAFGSLLIAIVQVVRAILEYIDNKTKNSQSTIAQFVMKCMKCCLWCLEKFLKFLTKNAYIMTAIYGQNFCTAAKNAFSLILRNLVRVFVVDKVTDFVLFIGKLVVVGAIGSLAFFFFDGTIATKASFLKNYTPSLNYYLFPVIIIIIATYIVASLFFNVYNMAVDTLFLCFLEDMERNDGSPEKPYFMSKELMKILGKQNVRAKEGEGEGEGKKESAM